MSVTYLRLSPWRVGLALGLSWGLALFVLACISYNTIYYGHPFIQGVDSIYIGYSPTIEGGFIGFGWGFIAFFIFGWFMATVYNMLLPRHRS